MMSPSEQEVEENREIPSPRPRAAAAAAANWYLIVLAEELELVVGAVLELGAVLAIGLELVDELVDHVPEPLVGELHVDDAVEDDAEEAAVVVPGLDALARGGGEAGVEVAEPHLAVEEAEDVVVVDVGGDGLGRGPGALAEHAVREPVEAPFVHLVDLVHVLLAYVAVEVDDEGLHGVGDEVGVVPDVGGARGGGGGGRRSVGRAARVVVVVGGRHGWGGGRELGFFFSPF